MYQILIDKQHNFKFIYLSGHIYALADEFILTTDCRLNGQKRSDMLGFPYSWIGTERISEDLVQGQFTFHYEGFETVPHELMLSIQERFNNDMVLSFNNIIDATSNSDFYVEAFRSSMYELHSGTQRDELNINSELNKIQPMHFNISGIIGDEVYTGLHSYHSHDYDTLNSMAADSDGMLVGVELEVELNRSMLQDAFTACKSNFFYLEKDSSIENYGVEVITVPLSPEKACDKSTWAFTDFLSEHGASSYDTGRCGLHIHISKKAFGSNRHEIERTLFNVYTMYVNTLERYIPMVFLRDYVEYASNPDSGLTPKQKGIMYLYDDENIIIPDETFDSVKDGISDYKSSRRYAINTNKEMTIEFRQGRGTLNKKSIVTMIEFVVLLVKFCKNNTLKYCTYNNFTNFVREKSKNKKLYERLLMRE